MPIHLASSSCSRRDFLRTSALAGAGFLAARASAQTGAAAGTDADLWALLNDTHVAENAAQAAHGQNISGNLAHVARSLAALPNRPAGVIINGDCAHNKGTPGDYAQFRRLLEPVVGAGVPVHMTMGNHDHRETFFKVLDTYRPEDSPVASRHVGVVRGKHVNFFLLDSLKETNVVEGRLGEVQISWLEDALDKHADKPAVVMAHHNPQWQENPPGAKFRWSGLEESAAVFDMLHAKRHVKAYLHGHIHRWGLSRHEDLHVINTPAVGYVHDPAIASTGWVMGRFSADGVDLTRYCIDPADPKHDKTFRLEWRK